MEHDENRAYLAKKVKAKGGIDKAATFYGVSYNTLASILNGNRPMGERTLARIRLADPRVNEHKLRAIKTYKSQKTHF
jgi:lambda repressor-like predicted transcriptional regulator